MRKLFVLISISFLTSGAVYAAGDQHLASAPDRTGNLPALQNGAKIFINNCLNCHSSAFVRYSRLLDIGLTEVQIRENLLFTGKKIGDLMTTSMRKTEAKSWFGVAPPDLSVITRARSSSNGSGADWVYTYLRSFYQDNSRPTGWNNAIFPNVAMPHVLWKWQGTQTQTDGKFALTIAGTQTLEEFDNNVGDLVGFLSWMADPNKQQRERIGFFVLFGLFIMILIMWRLNKIYWRDIK